jgi:hypothetical protein
LQLSRLIGFPPRLLVFILAFLAPTVFAIKAGCSVSKLIKLKIQQTFSAFFHSVIYRNASLYFMAFFQKGITMNAPLHDL